MSWHTSKVAHPTNMKIVRKITQGGPIENLHQTSNFPVEAAMKISFRDQVGASSIEHNPNRLALNSIENAHHTIRIRPSPTSKQKRAEYRFLQPITPQTKRHQIGTTYMLSLMEMDPSLRDSVIERRAIRACAVNHDPEKLTRRHQMNFMSHTMYLPR